MTTTICLTIAVLFRSAGVSWSQDYQKGYAACESGDFVTALWEWIPLATMWEMKAQNELGPLYAIGQGLGEQLRRCDFI